jgi:hypothetical protein
MKTIRLTENNLRSIIKESVSRILNEISPEFLSRAYVGANVDYDNLKSSEEPTATNRNGRKVYRDTQGDRRNRQIHAFSNRIGNDLSTKLGRNVKIATGNSGGDTYYYGEVDRGSLPIYHHYSHVNGNDPTDSYHGEVYDNGYPVKVKIGNSDIKAADYVADLTDAMAGYHDELTGGEQYKKRINKINDRVNDVDNINRYKDELNDYEEAKRQSEIERSEFDRLPWYKKIGREKPRQFTRQEPQYPKTKTGPYFMPDNPEGLMKQADRTKANRENNIAKYNNILKR